MQIQELLSHLKNKGIVIRLKNDDSLSVTAPKGVVTPEIAQQIKSLKKEIIVFLKTYQDKEAAKSFSAKITADREQPLPLSQAQERFWFLDQLQGNTAANNIPQILELTGNLSKSILERCVVELLARHEILRTTYDDIDGRPIQIINPPPSYSLPYIDLSHYAEATQQSEAQRLIEEEVKRPFALKHDLMLRAKLLKLTPDRYYFIFTTHHIASDGWSSNILWRELVQLYNAFTHNAPSPLPHSTVQYADYAAWQQSPQYQQALIPQIAYWKKTLGNKPAITELPTDFTRPSVRTYNGNQHRLSISSQLLRELQLLSKQSGATLFMTMLAAFNLLMSRLIAQEDIIVGTPVLGRNNIEFEQVIGCFINMLALRTNITESPDFIALLNQVRQVCLHAYANQDVPFEKLLAELQLERDLSRTPLFQILFNMLPAEKDQQKLIGIQEKTVQTFDWDSNFDMTLYLQEESDQTFTLMLVYNADIYTSGHMAELLSQYHHLLNQIVANPRKNIYAYSLLTRAAQDKLPDPTETIEAKWENSVLAQIAKQVRADSSSVAIIDGQTSLTYAELEARSNQLSHHFISSGVQPQEVVAIYGERSASLVIAILGILKAGAAFLILDPAYPAKRLINYLVQSKTKALLHINTTDDIPPEIETYLTNSESTLYLQLSNLSQPSQSDLLGRYPTETPNIEIKPDDLAYIAFTSGSTGQPKGVLGTHQPIAHFFPWHIKTFSFTSTDRFSMLSGLAHDPLLRDIFTPLCAGAALCIPTQNELLNPNKLFNWLREQEISVIHLTPAMSRLIAEGAKRSDDPLPALNYAFFGGEPLTYNAIENLHPFAPHMTLVNFYGATETPQAMSYYVVNDSVNNESKKQTIPLGRGIAGAQLMILNKNKDIAGINELGEIYIRTPYLVKGYLNDAQLTSERFLANPFVNNSEDRMYKTGDFGYYDLDGNVNFSERKDQQVKVRGFRIDLAEIEYTLSRIPGIKDCVVLTSKDALNENRIVAYYRGTASLSSAELRNKIRAYLPSYMVPSAFIVMTDYPRTPNGKIDKEAFPLPEQSDIASKRYTPPKTVTQEKIVQIWQDVLPIPQIGIDDDFFDLGGHSLLAIQMLSQIRNIFQVDIDLSELFRSTTVRDIGLLVDNYAEDHDSSVRHPESKFKSLVCIHTTDDTTLPTLFCVHGGGGNILFFQDWKKHLNDLSLYGFQARGIDGISSPHTSIEEMARDYIYEMKDVQPKGPYYLAGYSGGGSVALEMADYLRNQGDEVPVVFLLDSYHPDVGGRKLRIDEHIETALQNPFNFVLEKTAKKKEELQLKLHAKQIEQYIDNGQKIPLELRDQYLRTNFLHLRDQYVTKPYDGDVVLFSAAEVWTIFDHVAREHGWQDSLKNLAIYEIPGGHDDMIRAPNVGILVEKIKHILYEYCH